MSESSEKLLVAEVVIEPDYWNRGHFHEGHRRVLKALTNLQKLPLGTKLYVEFPTKDIK